MAEPVITVENLSKRYVLGQETHDTLRDQLSHSLRKLKHGFLKKDPATAAKEEFWALKDINFSINQGDVVGIIGRNGAGKSTLLKILSRITEPTTGSIHIKGRVASMLEVGTGFHPELSGRDNIFLNGAILGMSKAEIRKKFDEIVAFAEIERFLDTPVKRYSSGMYVRLAFAVAAHLEPEILIVDEVLAVGDSVFQEKCLGKIKAVSGEEGRTVLFVSHNMGAIQLLCKKGILLSQGHMAGMGAIEEMVPLYLNSFASRGNERGGPSKELVIAIESATMTVEEGRSWLLIEVAVTTPTPLSCEIEFHLLNTQGVPVAFSTSWAPKLRAALQFKSGETHQRWRLDVSHLANGHYILKAQLQLPMEKVLASCEAEGSVQVYRPPLNGKIRALEQSWCVGGVELNLELLPDRSS